MTTVKEHYNVRTACWRDLGGCTTFHAVHVHVDFDPHGVGTPICDGGQGGWNAPGSPHLTAFAKEARAEFPTLQLEYFNCRKIEGTNSWSQHSFWNAVDIMTPTVPIGQKVWDWLHGPYIPPEPPTGGDLVLTDADALQLGYSSVASWRTQEMCAKAVADVLAGRAKRTGQDKAYNDQYDKTQAVLGL